MNCGGTSSPFSFWNVCHGKFKVEMFVVTVAVMNRLLSVHISTGSPRLMDYELQ